MIDRPEHAAQLRRLLREFRVVGLVGPRQVGKTTLARALTAAWKGPTQHFDLERRQDLALLVEPELSLGDLRGLVVIDEVHHRPELFGALRVLVDRPRTTTRFLILGSASPALLRQGSESLAGRIAYHELGALSVREVGSASMDELWLRGGFPRSFLARSLPASERWRRQFLRTFVERDAPSFGLRVAPSTLLRLWTMLAHWHGQVWSGSEFGRALGVADTTVRAYVDALASMFIVRQLPPWIANLAKRQVKSPKIYLRDSGVLHSLLGLRTRAELDGHPKVGASWEGFLLDEVIGALGAEPHEVFFWATHQGAELDLLVLQGRSRLGFEFKRTTAPAVTKSMHIALEDLELDRLDVIHAGERTFKLGPRIRAVAAARLIEDLR